MDEQATHLTSLSSKNNPDTIEKTSKTSTEAYTSTESSQHNSLSSNSADSSKSSTKLESQSKDEKALHDSYDSKKDTKDNETKSRSDCMLSDIESVSETKTPEITSAEPTRTSQQVTIFSQGTSSDRSQNQEIILVGEHFLKEQLYTLMEKERMVLETQKKVYDMYDSLYEKMNNARKEGKAEFREDMKDLKEEHKNDKKELNDDHKVNMENLKNSLSGRIRDLENDVKKLALQITSLQDDKLKLSIDLARYKTKYDDFSDKKEEETSLLEKIKKERDTLLLEGKDKENSITRMKLEMEIFGEKMKNQLEKKNEQIDKLKIEEMDLSRKAFNLDQRASVLGNPIGSFFNTVTLGLVGAVMN
eukprot:TRINITY_DN6297_c0_g1_i1.p1 TRINITY_DN6297_c0_g1~~TRINITY_DN6297_c0_g1_i1.p1  ORF type:complete len:417 (+),score=12.45 TRINITY_DN6297_c0_g1_i1:170-1252(+)